MNLEKIVKNAVNEGRTTTADKSIYWYLNLDFRSNPFSQDISEEETVKTFVNREKPIEMVAKRMGNILSEPVYGHFFLVGATGIGKTALFTNILFYLKRYKEESKIEEVPMRITIPDILTYESDKSVYPSLMAFQRDYTLNSRIIIFDEWNKFGDINPVLLFNRITEMPIFRKTFKFFLLTPPIYNELKGKNFKIFEDSLGQIFLKALRKHEFTDMIRKRILYFKKRDRVKKTKSNEFSIEFDEELNAKLYEFTYGIPASGLLLLSKSLDFAFRSNKRELNFEILNQVAEKEGCIVDNLSKLQKNIIHLLLAFPQGVSAMELQKFLNIKRNTTSRHLNLLYKLNFLFKRRVGREAIFTLKPIPRSIFEYFSYIGKEI